MKKISWFYNDCFVSIFKIINYEYSNSIIPIIFNEYKLIIENILDFYFVSVHWYLNQQGYVLMDADQVKTSCCFFQ